MNNSNFFSPKMMAAIVASGVILLGSIIALSWGVSLNNTEVQLRTTIEAKQEDNKQQLANMRNKFKETASVTDKEADLLTNAFVKYAEARAGQGGGSLATFVTEAVPTIKPETLRNLQNILESSRNSWVQRQTELLDVNRVHKTLLREFPGNMLFSVLGRQEIKIIVVTSEDSEKAFATGKEESVQLFK